ncbi:MAG TPA: nuclear transport factor 2 family protein [Burkholderiaceae bacterium]|nr:nuclear transport factor 2 family protein [Burkholderiaceae bacterium]
MDLDALLERFGERARARDAAGFAALFTDDGLYDDGFFGRHAGRADIAAMLERFHVGGESFCWTFSDAVLAGDLGYATYCFSYLSREPESPGRLVVFDGIARLRLRDGLIAHYAESFDRGTAFVQLGYAPPRVSKLLDRYARGLRDTPEAARHLEARRARGLPT